MNDTRSYLIVIQQIVGGERGHSTTYSREGTPFADRAEAIAHGLNELGHDDFNIATLQGGRLVAFGWGEEDFGPDDGYDLAEIARHLCLPGATIAHLHLHVVVADPTGPKVEFRMSGRRNGKSAPKCMAHGDAACPLCSRSADGNTRTCHGCAVYAETGMHWDTCPNRVRGPLERPLPPEPPVGAVVLLREPDAPSRMGSVYRRYGPTTTRPGWCIPGADPDDRRYTWAELHARGEVTLLVEQPRRQHAYDAVYATIRQHPPHSTDGDGRAAENARVWRAVEAALDAMGIPRGENPATVHAAARAVLSPNSPNSTSPAAERFAALMAAAHDAVDERRRDRPAQKRRSLDEIYATGTPESDALVAETRARMTRPRNAP